jgi:flavin-binding protein dodecin
MSNHVYKSLELTGSSSDSIEGAVSNAVTKASETVHNLRWFEVTDIRGEIENNAVAYWQITMKVGFTLD